MFKSTKYLYQKFKLQPMITLSPDGRIDFQDQISQTPKDYSAAVKGRNYLQVGPN